ncbi:MAG: hypothetical protein J6D47_04060 [Peptostreptococcaceae bacterium]|nr:hypothetical protein [Peptostreptococcaceae bacterium]
MIIELLSKEDKEQKYYFESNKRNIVVLNGLLYELTDDESKKFYNGDYMREHLKDSKEGYNLDGFDLGLYVLNAPFCLEDYFLSIK